MKKLFNDFGQLNKDGLSMIKNVDRRMKKIVKNLPKEYSWRDLESLVVLSVQSTFLNIKLFEERK